MNWSALRERLLGKRELASALKTLKLPPMPHAVMEFLRAADDPEATLGQLAKIVETDAGLSCELLKQVNSSAFATRNRTSTVHQALSLLGLRPVRLFLISAGIRQATAKLTSKLLHVQNFWNANLERALFSREVAKLLHADADLAYSASLLHDFLLVPLTNELVDTYLRFLALPESSRGPLSQFEQTQLGWDHSLATAQIMLGWGFPDDLVCCVLLHHGGLKLIQHADFAQTSAAAVAAAALIPDVLRQSGQGMEALVQLTDVIPGFDLLELATRTDEAFSTISTRGRSDFSLKHHCEKHLALVAH